jgi:hypothetical protein
VARTSSAARRWPCPRVGFGERFLTLDTRFAGKIMQKFVNYRCAWPSSTTSLGTWQLARPCRPSSTSPKRPTTCGCCPTFDTPDARLLDHCKTSERNLNTLRA